jgi:hypothetical protein
MAHMAALVWLALLALATLGGAVSIADQIEKLRENVDHIVLFMQGALCPALAGIGL